MSTSFNFIDPDAIVSVVVVLIVFSVGTFAFFITVNSISEETTPIDIADISDSASNIFNVVGIVVILGVIMAIVGAVYSFLRPSYTFDDWDASSYSPSTEQTYKQPINEKLPTYVPIKTEASKPERANYVAKETEETLKKKLQSGEITANEYNQRMISLWFQKK